MFLASDLSKTVFPLSRLNLNHPFFLFSLTHAVPSLCKPVTSLSHPNLSGPCSFQICLASLSKSVSPPPCPNIRRFRFVQICLASDSSKFDFTPHLTLTHFSSKYTVPPVSPHLLVKFRLASGSSKCSSLMFYPNLSRLIPAQLLLRLWLVQIPKSAPQFEVVQIRSSLSSFSVQVLSNGTQIPLPGSPTSISVSTQTQFKLSKIKHAAQAKAKSFVSGMRNSKHLKERHKQGTKGLPMSQRTKQQTGDLKTSEMGPRNGLKGCPESVGPKIRLGSIDNLVLSRKPDRKQRPETTPRSNTFVLASQADVSESLGNKALRFCIYSSDGITNWRDWVFR